MMRRYTSLGPERALAEPVAPRRFQMRELPPRTTAGPASSGTQRGLPSRSASAVYEWQQGDEQYDCCWFGDCCGVGPGEAILLDVEVADIVEELARPDDAERVLARGRD